MAHLLVVEVLGGGYGLIDQLRDDGHSFTFVTQDLNTYLRTRNFRECPLSEARDIIVVNPYDYERFRTKIFALHQNYPIDGVLCSLDFRLPDISRLAAELNVPFLNKETSSLLRDKYLVRGRLIGSSVRQPKCALAETKFQLEELSEVLGYPVVIKPKDGYASMHVYLVHNRIELQTVLTALPEHPEYGLGQSGSGAYLVEQLIDGPVVSCETLTIFGRHYILGVTDRLACNPTSAVEFGGCFPSTRQDCSAIYSATLEILDVLGYDHGPSHIEFILRGGEPYLVEVNARLIGGPLPMLLSLALGRSVFRDLISASIASKEEPPTLVESIYQGVACIRWVCASNTGTLTAIRPPVSFHKAVKVFDSYLRPGTKVRPPINNADRIAYIMVLAEEQGMAESIANDAASQIELVIEESN